MFSNIAHEAVIPVTQPSQTAENDEDSLDESYAGYPGDDPFLDVEYPDG